VLDAYCRFLYTIGEQSLPHSFVVVANRLNAGDASQMLSQDTTTPGSLKIRVVSNIVVSSRHGRETEYYQ